MNKLRRKFGGNLWGPAILAVVIVGLVVLWAQSYLGRVNLHDGRIQDCLETTQIRWITVGKNQADASREWLLAGRTRGLVAEAHEASAKASANLANVTLMFTAPTPERRRAYCERRNPHPSLLGG